MVGGEGEGVSSHADSFNVARYFATSLICVHEVKFVQEKMRWSLGLCHLFDSSLFWVCSVNIMLWDKYLMIGEPRSPLAWPKGTS